MGDDAPGGTILCVDVPVSVMQSLATAVETAAYGANVVAVSLVAGGGEGQHEPAALLARAVAAWGARATQSMAEVGAVGQPTPAARGAKDRRPTYVLAGRSLFWPAKRWGNERPPRLSRFVPAEDLTGCGFWHRLAPAKEWRQQSSSASASKNGLEPSSGTPERSGQARGRVWTGTGLNISSFTAS